MIEYLMFILGMIVLVKGADYLVEGSSGLAKKLGVSSLVIGLTIVAFGTSMPELVVNLIAAVEGSGEVAIGTIIGSNLSNILFVLGLTAFLGAVKLQRSTVWKEIPFSLLAALVLLVLVTRGLLGTTGSLIYRSDGLILLLFFAIFLYYAFGMMINRDEELSGVDVEDMSYSRIAVLILIGSIALYFGGDWVVSGVKTISGNLGLSEFMISALVIAIGTSLPELITSLTAALKQDVDMAVGNIVGSNIFNVMWVLGISSIIRPIELPSFILVDVLLLVGVSILLFMYLFVGKRHVLEKWQGFTFLMLYAAYVAFLLLRG